MNVRNVVVSGTLALVAAGLFSTLGGCFGDLAKHLTKERTGNITMVFVNETRYRAIFSYGTWDEWDRSPGPVSLQQALLDPQIGNEPATLPCRRNAAIGTQPFIDRVIETNADEALSTLIPEALNPEVRFSRATFSAGPDYLPTEGTAQGVELLLGVDFSCEDQIVFTFVEDPDADGGFRVDYEVIRDVDQDE